MKNKSLKHLKFIPVLLSSAYLLTGCNSGTSSGVTPATNQNNLVAQTQKLKSSDIGINYTLDGETLSTQTDNWNDMGWHILTLTVTSAPQGQSPIPVQGIWSSIGSPENPAIDGEALAVQDINCNSATFAKVGDTCSAYVKVSYDYANHPNAKPIITVNFAPNNYQSLPVLIQAHDWIKPQVTVGIYRAVNPIESQYYSGNNVKANISQYSILLMQNGSLSPITVSTVGIPHNSNAFQIIHRTVSGNDPNYGTNNECSITPNQSIGQVSALSSLNASCIIVYKANDTSTQSDIYDSIAIGSTAERSFPSGATSYNMHAHYVVASPIPNQGFNSIKGSFNTPLPIDQFQISYNFTPNRLPILPGSNGTSLILPDGTNVWNGEQILTSLGAPTTISSVQQQSPDGNISPNSGSVTACGGAWASANGVITQTHTLTNQGVVKISLNIDSDALCGGTSEQHTMFELPFSGYNNQIYSVDQKGCGGNNWDIGGYATLSGSCNGSWCSYNLAVSASHGGVGGQCHDYETTNIPFSFPQPTTNNIASLNGGDSSSITFAAQGGQVMYGAIGTSSGQIPQSVSCDASNTCNVVGTYSNGQSANGMSYQIGLNQGDVLNNGMVQFTRLDGYNLNTFTMQVSGN